MCAVRSVSTLCVLYVLRVTDTAHCATCGMNEVYVSVVGHRHSGRTALIATHVMGFFEPHHPMDYHFPPNEEVHSRALFLCFWGDTALNSS